jgi:hypothetical protein
MGIRLLFDDLERSIRIDQFSRLFADYGSAPCEEYD